MGDGHQFMFIEIYIGYPLCLDSHCMGGVTIHHHVFPLKNVPFTWIARLPLLQRSLGAASSISALGLAMSAPLVPSAAMVAWGLWGYVE